MVKQIISIFLGYPLVEGSLEVKLPTIWTDEKQSREEAERRERLEERRVEEKEERRCRCEKRWESRETLCFPMISGSGGSKSRLAKAAGAEPAGQTRDEKLHAVVARSTFASQNVQNTWVSEHFWKLRCRKSVRRCGARSQNVQNTSVSDHFWKLRCRKSARRCGAKHISKWTCTKHTRCGPLLAVEMSKQCTPLWREAHFEVNMYKTSHVRATFGGSDVVLRGRRKGLCTLSKASQTWGFCSISETMAGVGHLKRIFKDAFRVAGAVQKTCSSEMFGSQCAHFLRGVAFWSIRSSGLLRWFCVTGAALRSGRRSTLHRWSGKIAKHIGTRLPALHSTFHFWRKSRRIALFLTLLSSNIEEVSQNCCGFGRC